MILLLMSLDAGAQEKAAKRKVLAISFSDAAAQAKNKDFKDSQSEPILYYNSGVIVVDGSWKLHGEPKGLFPNNYFEPIEEP